jgi:membrane-bound ClpP family serine protease
MEEPTPSWQIANSKWQMARKERCKVKLSVFLKLILGLVLVTAGVWAMMHWFYAIKVIAKGCIGVVLLLCGLVILGLARE